MIPWLGEYTCSTIAVKRAYELVLGKMEQPRPTEGDVEVEYLNSGCLQWSGVEPNPGKKMWASPAEIGNLRVEPGDLLVAEGGDVGRAAVYDGEPGRIFQKSLHRARSYEGSEVRYLKYVLIALHGSGWLDILCNKATMAHFTAEKLGSLEIPYIPVEEQRCIADFLDDETARIDALIQNKRRTIGLLEEREQSVINQVSPGAMVRGVDGRPVGIAGMQCVRLGALAVVHGGFTVDAGRDNGTDSVTMPYLRVANVLDGSLALEDIKDVTLPRALADRCTLRSGDVLMTEGGDPDKLGRGTVWPGDIAPCLHQNAIFAVRPDSRLLPEYLALVTRTRYARAYFEMTASKSTGIAHTSSTRITAFRVPMRTVAEQRQLVRNAQDALTRIAAPRELAERQVSLLTERRQALITAAVTGGISV